MILLLDSDIIIDWLDARLAPELKTFLERAQLGLSTVSIMEVYEGIWTDDGPAQARLQLLVNQMSVLPFDIETAFIAADIRRELRRQRRQISHRALDIQIAATAIRHDASLLSRNRRDFEDIPGLRLRSEDAHPA